MDTDIKTEMDHAARVLGYTFLYGALIKEPSMVFLKQLKESRPLDSFPYREESDNIRKGLELIESSLAQSPSYRELEDKLVVEYTWLFITPDKKQTHPWESVQMHSGRLFSLDDTLEVRKHYVKYGLLPERLNLEPDDHIALELQFMKILAIMTMQQEEAQYHEKTAELIADQKDFMEKHLMRWAPRWAESLRQHARSGFYQGLALVLPEYLNRDYQQLCRIS